MRKKRANRRSANDYVKRRPSRLGLSPLVREDASSRITGNDSVRFGEESFDDIGTGESFGEEFQEVHLDSMDSHDNLKAAANGTLKPLAIPNGILAEN